MLAPTLFIKEIEGFVPEDLASKIQGHLQPREKDAPTRKAVCDALCDIFPDFFVTIGGHHVALHDTTGRRLCIVVGTSPDFN